MYTLILKQTAVGIPYKDYSVECLVPSINSFDPNAIHFASPWQVLLNFYLTASIKFRLNAARYMCHKPSRKYLGGYGVLGWMTFWNSFRTLGCGFVILLSGPELLYFFTSYMDSNSKSILLQVFSRKLVKLCVTFLMSFHRIILHYFLSHSTRNYNRPLSLCVFVSPQITFNHFYVKIGFLFLTTALFYPEHLWCLIISVKINSATVSWQMNIFVVLTYDHSRRLGTDLPDYMVSHRRRP